MQSRDDQCGAGWQLTTEESVIDEVRGAELGDRRLEERLQRVVRAVFRAPSSSFPAMAGTDAELEGTYRFFSNKRVTPAAILAPHQRATSERVRSQALVVVAHDTSEVCFGSLSRGDLGRVGKGKSYGFGIHVALAITGDEERAPLGVLSARSFNRPFGSPRLSPGRNKLKEGCISHRWWEGVCDVREQVGEGRNVLHVMDREADDYALFSQMVAGHERFVVRQQHDRRSRKDRPEKVRRVLSAVPVLATREVKLSPRRPSPRKAHNQKRHPLRKARVAQLEIRAAAATIPRSDAACGIGPESLTLNLVFVDEPHPPRGCDPIQWWLWTTEPIENAADVLAIVDAYRTRWRIEEYFKALKMGCALESRQLESEHALLVALAVFLPVAWRLLLLRTLARQSEPSPASHALTTPQLSALRGALAREHRLELPKEPTARDALTAIAKLGGHIAHNGEPGWIVLARGFDRLLDIELGFSLAISAM